MRLTQSCCISPFSSSPPPPHGDIARVVQSKDCLRTSGCSITYAVPAPLHHMIGSLKLAMACCCYLLLLELLKNTHTLKALGSIQPLPVKPSSLLSLQKKRKKKEKRMNPKIDAGKTIFGLLCSGRWTTTENVLMA